MSNSRRARRRLSHAAPPSAPPAAPEADDDRVGRENGYRCDECRGDIVTVDRDPGVTPMFLACRATEGCTGQSVSMGYPRGSRPPHLPAPAWEWYRPDAAELAGETAEVRDYVARGGLLLRPL